MSPIIIFLQNLSTFFKLKAINFISRRYETSYSGPCVKKLSLSKLFASKSQFSGLSLILSFGRAWSQIAAQSKLGTQFQVKGFSYGDRRSAFYLKSSSLFLLIQAWSNISLSNYFYELVCFKKIHRQYKIFVFKLAIFDSFEKLNILW